MKREAVKGELQGKEGKVGKVRKGRTIPSLRSLPALPRQALASSICFWIALETIR